MNTPKSKWIETKSNEEVKVELRRKLTLFKLKVYPFLRSLNMEFFMRLAIFGGILYGINYATRDTEGVIMTIPEGTSSATKFSKTLG